MIHFDEKRKSHKKLFTYIPDIVGQERVWRFCCLLLLFLALFTLFSGSEEGSTSTRASQCLRVSFCWGTLAFAARFSFLFRFPVFILTKIILIFRGSNTGSTRRKAGGRRFYGPRLKFGIGRYNKVIIVFRSPGVCPACITKE